MDTRGRAGPARPTSRQSTPTRRYVLAWALMIGSLLGFWCCRPWLGTRAFQLRATRRPARDVEDRFAALPGARGLGAGSPPLRMLAYCVWPGMQPHQFLAGQVTAADAPVPSVSGFLLNVTTGAALLWLAPRLLPAATPVPIRFWIALVGSCSCSLSHGLTSGR